MSVYGQLHLLSSINFTVHNVKPGTLKTGRVKINIERFHVINNAFPFMSSVKGTPAYWKLFYMI